MTISQNYVTLQEQIADELGDRQDLLAPLPDSLLVISPIQNAIQSAIAKWERKKFYFNEFVQQVGGTVPSPFQTAVGQEYYGQGTQPTDWGITFPTFSKLDKVWVLIANNRYVLEPRTSRYLDDISVSLTSRSQPFDVAYVNQQLRFYPFPDGVYQIGMDGIQKFTPLSKPTDANAWTSDAYDLIRSEAKLILAREVLFDDDIETAMVKAIYGDPGVPSEIGYLASVMGETGQRKGRGRIRPTHF